MLCAMFEGIRQNALKEALQNKLERSGIYVVDFVSLPGPSDALTKVYPL